MTVKFFAYLREAQYAGCKEMTCPAPETVARQGEMLRQRFGPAFRSEVFSPAGRDLGERVSVMGNGRGIECLQGLDAPLTDRDTVQIFPVVAGG